MMTRREAWVRFAAAVSADSAVASPEGAARWADLMLAEMDKRFLRYGRGEADAECPPRICAHGCIHSTCGDCCGLRR